MKEVFEIIKNKPIFICLFVTICLFSLFAVLPACTGTAKDRDRVLDSLHAELALKNHYNDLLDTVVVLVDSIISERNTLRHNLNAGAKYELVTKHLRNIKSQLAFGREKIIELENACQRVAGTRTFPLTILQLKAEISGKEKEIRLLDSLINVLRSNHKSFITAIDLQQMQMSNYKMKIDEKRYELTCIQSRMEDLIKEGTAHKAFSYFELGKAKEETAKRTKFAPARRRKSLEEALHYYKKAHEFGNTQAELKVKELMNRLK